MLSILPAFILLLLQGPAHADRTVAHGRSLAALAELQNRMEAAKPVGSPAVFNAEHALLASLLGIVESPDLRRAQVAKAFVSLLQMAAPIEFPTPLDDRSSRASGGCPPDPYCAIASGFPASNRSRDGPSEA